jgi:hypothetical protein
MRCRISWVRWTFVATMVLSCESIFAQEINVRAGFISDSTRVGEEVLFYLTAQYPREQQIVFPDSTFAFTPFELKKKDYFPTSTRDTLSYDSAVYALRTFEINTVQSLRLPVYKVNVLDCTRVYSNRDTIALRLLVQNLPDSLMADLPLKATTAYQHVEKQINTPLIIVIASFVIILTGIGWVVFGPAIRRYYRIRNLQRIHEAFSETYIRYVTSVQSRFTPSDTEAAVVTWKKYMEQISRTPYTKLTTKETAQLEKDELLVKNLRIVDSAIYGTNTNVIDSLQSLKSYADKRFNSVMTEVKNG